MAAKVDMDGLVGHLQTILQRRFSRDVSQIFYGDILVYLPSAFGSSRREQKAVIALSPAYNHLVEGTRTTASEVRLLGIDIIIMVNITPFFESNPTEAYGERILVKLATEIAQYLTQEVNVTLDGRVDFTTVGDIDWAWKAARNQALRGCSIAYEARVRINRLETPLE